MTVHLFADIECDTDGCDETETYEDIEDRDDARDQAGGDGWRWDEITGDDLCPNHAPKEEE